MTRVGEAPNIYTVRQQIGELIGLGASRSADEDLKDPTLQPQALDLLARQVHASPEPAIGLPPRSYQYSSAWVGDPRPPCFIVLLGSPTQVIGLRKLLRQRRPRVYASYAR